MIAEICCAIAGVAWLVVGIQHKDEHAFAIGCLWLIAASQSLHIATLSRKIEEKNL